MVAVPPRIPPEGIFYIQLPNILSLKTPDLISILLGNGNGTFQSPLNSSLSSPPWGVAVGDLNGDTLTDLAIANFYGDNVSVLIGKGDGTFEIPVDYGAGSGPRSIVVGKFNNDDMLDFAVANINGANVSIFLNNGNGTFANPVNYNVGSNPISLALGDFNADGRLDLVVANNYSGNISTLVGNLDGTFQTAVDYSVGGYGYPSAVAMGDFNLDGKIDLAVASHEYLSTLLGDGSGTFQPAVAVPAAPYPYGVAVGDFNIDGKADLAVTSDVNNGSVLVFLNTTTAPSGLISWWRGEGDATDSEDGNDGSLNNGLTFASGKIGQAFSFDGINDEIGILKNPNLNLRASDFAIEAWVNIAQTQTPQGVIFFNYAGVPAYGLRITADGKAELSFRPGVAITGSNNDPIGVATGTKNLNDGQWHHLVGMRSGTTALIYVDGVLESSTTNPAILTVNGGSVDTGGCQYARIGAIHTSTGHCTSPTSNLLEDHFFQGLIDEVKIYNRVLTASEIQTAAQQPPNTPIDNNSAPNTVTENAATGSSVGITVLAIDPNNDPLTYSLTDNAGGRFAILDSSTGVVTVADGSLLNFDSATSHTINVQVSDSAGGSSSASFVISVTNVAPKVLIPIADVIAHEDDADTFIDLSSTFVDSHLSDLLTLSVSGNTNSPLLSTSLVGNTLTLHYQPGQSGQALLTLRATDNGFLQVEHTFVVTVLSHSIAYKLSVTKTGTGTGTVLSLPPGISCGIYCNSLYAPNTLVALTATPSAGSVFSGWSGACSGTGSCQVTMNSAKSVTANFTAYYNLSVTKPGTGNGTVLSTPAGINCGSICSKNYPPNTLVALTATPSAGSVFSGWSGACSGSGSGTGIANCQVTMNAAKSVIANFTAFYNLSVTKQGSGSGKVLSTPAGINCGSTCSKTYAPGSLVTLTATPIVAGSVFSGWSGACSGTGTCQVTMNAAKSVIANFTAYHILTVYTGGYGSGTVNSTPAGINCGSTCSKSYPAGSVVSLTATPTGVGTVFSGWIGACSGVGTCLVTMNAAKWVKANFFTYYTISVLKTGTGSGTVVSTPAGINCGSTCSKNYTPGNTISLTATPSAGSVFSGWSGACSGTGTCSLSTSSTKTATAHFTAHYNLSVMKQGTGSGTVLSTPAGINCGSTCNKFYAPSSLVTLTATPSAGSLFSGWSGACSGTGTCQVTMNAAKSVIANFTAYYNLSVAKQGTGSGTVISNPSGINCGSTCSKSYPSSTLVTLTATPSANSVFSGWYGACSGTGPCQVTMNAAKSVSAKFTAYYTLSVTKQGSGTVTSTPAGISCGSTCSKSFPPGSVIVLTAQPEGLLTVFKGWSGACIGTGACQVTLNAAKSVHAVFQ